MKILSDWIVLDGYCAGRIIAGTDPDKIENRVAFIEKTPRVRIRPSNFSNADLDHMNWAARPWKGDDANCPESRKWCDDMLTLLGYEL